MKKVYLSKIVRISELALIERGCVLVLTRFEEENKNKMREKNQKMWTCCTTTECSTKKLDVVLFQGYNHTKNCQCCQCVSLHWHSALFTLHTARIKCWVKTKHGRGKGQSNSIRPMVPGGQLGWAVKHTWGKKRPTQIGGNFPFCLLCFYLYKTLHSFVGVFFLPLV